MTTLTPHALILTAGLGTRLRPLSDELAKPAMPVAGQPLIRRIIASLATQHVVDVVMNLHHRPESLTAVVGDGSDLGVRVRYSWEQPRVLGSAGGPRQALEILGVETFFVINGDTLTEVDLAALAAAHERSGALVTMAVVPNKEFERYGGVRVESGDAVAGFARRGAESRGTWHFVGVQVVNAAAFASLPQGVPLNTVGGVYDDMIRTRPGSVRAFRCETPFWDIGTAADYLRTSLELSEGRGDVAAGARIDPGARVARSIVWEGARVEANASLDECIVGRETTVPAGASYRRSILLRNGGRLHVEPIGD